VLQVGPASFRRSNLTGHFYRGQKGTLSSRHNTADGPGRDWVASAAQWHYNQDEAYLVLSGEGFMTDDKGVERRFGTGDLAYFLA
jgi:uncharacterized cupin superfamily protein